MRILIATSEAVPFAKTGGLADVSSGLAKALDSSGHDVTLMMPCYRKLIKESNRGEAFAEIRVPLRNVILTANLYRTTLPGSDVEVILVDQPEFFDRPKLYNDEHGDYHDNAERFIFLSRAIVEHATTLGRFDIIHANDWQTSLVPALVLNERQTHGAFGDTGTVLTIHNMAFQGSFPAHRFPLTGLPGQFFTWQNLEFYGGLNMLKGAISLSDMVTTVSPTYAREICHPDFGYGLDPALLGRGEDLVGILNGIDPTVWNPATDTHIAENYDVSSVHEGKPVCKAALQQEFGLPQDPDSIIFGMVSRLTDQKGLDLITAKADEILQARVQFAFLGTGDPYFEQLLSDIRGRYPDKVGLHIGFDEGLAHRIEAGSDIYFMPSRFEPCGLNQMYSLAYGTVPIVHTVGGLADSIVDASTREIEAGRATGFQFSTYDANEFLNAVWHATGIYQHKRESWNMLIENGMRQDFTWNSSADQYVSVYKRAIENARMRRIKA